MDSRYMDMAQHEGGDMQAELHIDSALQNAYLETGQKHGIDPEQVYYSRRCEDVTERLVEKFRGLGLNAEPLNYEGFGLVTEHHFILLTREDKQEIYDATWQQFLEKPNPLAPKVLRTDITQLEKTLIDLGVKKEIQDIWLKTVKMYQQLHEKR